MPDTPAARVAAFCQWYALCDHEAAGTITHPVLGEVPCCQRCADKHDLKFTEVSA